MRTPRFGRAFSFIELMVVLVIIGILAAIVLPRFSGVTDDARSAAVQGDLAGVRSAIAGYRAKNVIAGTPAYPTVTQLTTQGLVLQADFPKNPYTQQTNVQSVSKAQALARQVLNAEKFGWNYYVDNAASPPEAIFYINADEPTNVVDSSGGTKSANEL